MNKKRVAIIGVVGVPARYGGLETLAHHLVMELSDELALSVYNSKWNYLPEERESSWNGAAIYYLPFRANGVQSIIYDIIAMLHAIIRNDALIVLGVSGCVFLPLLKLFFRKKKILVNIDGLEWRRPKWGKLASAYLKFAEKIAVKFADRVIADNLAIQQYVQETYGRDSDIIAYGGDHVKTAEMLPEDKEKYPFLTQSYGVKACRIEPENNIEMILEAFAQIDFMDLVILGNWNDSVFGKKLWKKYGSYSHIHLLDFVRDRRILDVLRCHADVYLHGHSAGGTNPSLVEAMNLGLPIIAYGGTVFNRNTTHHQALYFETSDQLLAQLKELKPEVRSALGEKMKKLGQKYYSWKKISRQYAQAIEELMGEMASVRQRGLKIAKSEIFDIS